MTFSARLDTACTAERSKRESRPKMCCRISRRRQGWWRWLIKLLRCCMPCNRSRPSSKRSSSKSSSWNCLRFPTARFVTNAEKAASWPAPEWCESSCQEPTRNTKELLLSSQPSNWWQASTIRGSMRPEAKSSNATRLPTATSTPRLKEREQIRCNSSLKRLSLLQLRTSWPWAVPARPASERAALGTVVAEKSTGATRRSSDMAEALLSDKTAWCKPKARIVRAASGHRFNICLCPSAWGIANCEELS
mmetsp:Transcript_127430/g.407837  ORF Transcript_127430/g.407837 Transcript_127430/m.407837 type:complete len:249 (+) Transcript_127430:285-1031(+)